MSALVVPVIAYAFIRQHTAAFTPASAPSFYQLTFAPSSVLANALEYLDRGATLSAILFLPVRSSLYAVFPSVGAAIVCGALVESIRARALRERRYAALPLEGAIAVCLLLAMPIYHERNGRWVEPARLSQRALRVITTESAAFQNRGTIVLHDVSDPASSFAGAFGTLATAAVRLYTGRDLQAWIDPPQSEWRTAELTPPDTRPVVAQFALDHGRVFRVQPGTDR